MEALRNAVAVCVPGDFPRKMMEDFPLLHPANESEIQRVGIIQSDVMGFLEAITASQATRPFVWKECTVLKVHVIGKILLNEHIFSTGPKTLRYRVLDVRANGYFDYNGSQVPIAHADVIAKFAMLIQFANPDR